MPAAAARGAARARLPRVAGLVLLEPVWRQLNTWHLTAAQVNWARTDLRYSGLLVGALLALAWHDPVWRARLQRLTRRGAFTFGLSAAAFVLLTATPPGSRPVLLRTDPELFLSLPVARMLLVVAEGRAGVFSTALEWAPLRWLGDHPQAPAHLLAKLGDRQLGLDQSLVPRLGGGRLQLAHQDARPGRG